MPPRQQPWPTIWLLTDERMGERLWEAIDRLPAQNAGILVRHYSLDEGPRRELAARIAGICSERGITLAIAGDPRLAAEVGAELVHNPSAPTDLPFSRSVHSIEEALSARRGGAALVFVSPVFATRSHPGRRPLSRSEAVHIARAAHVPAIALGGMNARKFELRWRGAFYGWAGIAAWLDDVA